MNNIYFNITIFHNTKETVTKIGHLTKINLTKMYRAAYQENLNSALSVVTSELNKKDTEYFAGYGTTRGMANYSVHLKPAKPNITIGNETVTTEALAVYSLLLHLRISQDLILRLAPHKNNHGFKSVPANLLYDNSICDGRRHYAQILEEQNQYLSKYSAFRVGGISEELLDMELDGQILRDKLELTGVIKHITPTVFSEQKGIWQIEKTKANIVEAMRHVKEVLEEIRQNLPDGEINKYSAFPYPQKMN
eukprot:10367370-Ditylum_brightwellii.AAC.1